MGRKKIEIKKIQNSEALQVSFSKRRAGLFKKANELATLTGAEVAMVVFSPAGKPYPLGLPDLDTVVNRYLLCNPQQQAAGESSTQPPNRHRSVLARDLSKRLSDARSLLDQQRGRSRPLSELVKSTAQDIGIQCGPDYEELNLDQLEKLQKDMVQLRGRLVERMDELKRERQPQQVLPGVGAYQMNCLNPTPVGFANPSAAPLPFGGDFGLAGSDTVNSTGYINPNTGIFPAMPGFGDAPENPFGFSDPFHDMMFSGEATGHYGMMIGQPQPGSGNNVAGPSNALRDARGNGSRM